ncbi:MAG: tetratricopeptide repeat-containing protein [Cyanobacteria bacterium J06642_9]
MLQHLHEQLQHSQLVAITAVVGMGGIGKTELALQYARTHWQQHYPGGVCWLEARDQDIATQILTFAQAQLALQPSDDLPIQERIAYCWRNWPDFGDSPAAALVVIDDVSDYAAIEDYLPSHERFTLLLTTRAQRLAATVKSFAIEVLSEAASLELLRQLTEDPERIDAELEQAKALCKWLGYLPLGLELVGRYLAIDLDLSLAELQGQLDEQTLEAEALTEMEAGMTASRNLTKAIELTWQRLSPEAQDLACLLGVFAPTPIPWLRVEACYPDVEPATLKRLRNIELLRLSLLQRVEQERYQLHPLIHRFMRTKLADDSPLIAAYCGVMVESAQEVDETPIFSQISAWREMVPHLAEAATEWVSRIEDEELFWPFTGLGRFYYGQGRYGEAKVWHERCVTITQARLGNDHPDIANSLNNLANLYRDQGRYSEAEPLFLKALEIVKASLGDTHPYISEILSGLALLYKVQGRYSEAEPLYLKALETGKASLGDDHPDVATRLNNLANLYRDQGRYSEAEPFFLKAIEIDEASLGDDHPDMAKSLSNLALLYWSQGRYGEAEPLFLKALETGKASLGDDHPDVATRLNNLAILYQSQGRYSEAEPLFLKALEIDKASLGNDHPFVATDLNGLALISQAQGRYSEAKSLFLKAIEISKTSLGDDHPDVARWLKNLANLYREQGRYSESEPIYIKSLNILFQRLGESHPKTQKSWDDFVDCIRQALESGQADTLSEHSKTQEVLQQLRSEDEAG